MAYGELKQKAAALRHLERSQALGNEKRPDHHQKNTNRKLSPYQSETMRRQIKIRPTITNRSNESLERYLSEISREPRISIEEEVELGRRAKNGDEAAVERLVRANLRLLFP